MAGLYANETVWAVDFSALIDASGVSYTDIADVVSIAFGGITMQTLETTVHGDTWRNHTTGLKDGGTIDMTVRFAPETHADLLDNIGETFATKVTFPKETSSNTTPASIEWNTILTSLSISAPHDGLLEASVTLQTTGAPTITDEAA